MSCHLEVIHVPGKLMIHQGTDGLSQGLWMTPKRTRCTSLMESSVVLEPVPFCWKLAGWVETTIGIPPLQPTFRHFGPLVVQPSEGLLDHLDSQTRSSSASHLLLLDCWVEFPLTTGAAFLVPRILQRTWPHISHFVVEYQAVAPQTLLDDCAYQSDIPFVLLIVPPHIRGLPSPVVDEVTPARAPFWIRQQVESMHGL
jgi:hypothetical protein